MFLDGSYSKERAKKYYQSLPIYYTHQALFYSDKKFTKKQILNIVKNDVNSLKMCDVNGYQTNHYKKILGYTRKIDKSAQSTINVLKKISKGRCDAIVCSKEPVYGGQLIGQFKIPKYIKSVQLSEYKPIAFYIWIAKTSPRGKELISKINNIIKEMHKDGSYHKLYKKYVLDKMK
jgi:polar amino acid transport system substrate-binding protein